MRQAGTGVVERRNRRQELPEQPHGGSRIRPKRRPLRRFQKGREPFAFDQIRDQRQLRMRIVEHRDRAHSREERVPELGKLIDAAPYGELEAALRGELATESQELQCGTGVVEQQQAIAERIGKALSVPGDEAGTGCVRREEGGLERRRDAHACDIRIEWSDDERACAS